LAFQFNLQLTKDSAQKHIINTVYKLKVTSWHW